MKKLKVLTVVGTRPEIIRLSRVLVRLDQHCDHVLVHTGQNYDYELNQIFFDDLGIRKPDHFLSAAGSSSAETIGNVIIATDKVLDEEKPDALLVSYRCCQPNAERFRSSIWRRVIAVSICEYQRRSIAVSLITRQTLT